MTRDEFIKKFPVGSKVRMKGWKVGYYWKILFHGDKTFFAISTGGAEATWEYYNDWLHYEEPQDFKLWDVVYDDILRKEGIVIGDVPCGDLWVFIPDMVMCRTIEPEKLKKVEGKVAMAPASFGLDESSSSRSLTIPITQEDSLFHKYSKRDDFRWPHSISSLTAEKVKK